MGVLRPRTQSVDALVEVEPLAQQVISVANESLMTEQEQRHRQQPEDHRLELLELLELLIEEG